ncbi:hypothetical protein MTP99_014432 [Tenebrio molitor]|nr:hypothetical protein MTP99_014432 [Tenebrio molitor]
MPRSRAASRSRSRCGPRDLGLRSTRSRPRFHDSRPKYRRSGKEDGVIVVGPRGRQRRVVQGELGSDTRARVVPAPIARRRRSRV